MKKRILAVLVTGLFLLTMTGLAQASLTTIGTATYEGADYNLIWNDDNNGNSVIWFDYTRDSDDWVNQNIWAYMLDSSLTYNIDPVYTVVWDADFWRLPSAGEAPESGYNQTTSEMGHLFYSELGLSAYPPFTTTAQLNATNFDNLVAFKYWSGTEYVAVPVRAWHFYMDRGIQGNAYKNSDGCGLAVRDGQISVVPEPVAFLLFGPGLLCLFFLKRKK